MNADKLLRAGALLALCLGSACVSARADRAERTRALRNPVQHNVYFACQSHCSRKSELSGACVEFDSDAAPACNLYSEKVVSRRRTEDEEFILDQYYGCMQICSHTTPDGLFCRSFGKNFDPLCEGAYKIR